MATKNLKTMPFEVRKDLERAISGESDIIPPEIFAELREEDIPYLNAGYAALKQGYILEGVSPNEPTIRIVEGLIRGGIRAVHPLATRPTQSIKHRFSHYTGTPV